MGNGIWTSGRTAVRGASAREFDQNSPDARGNWDGKVFSGPLSHGREFTPQEIWENYTYFIKQVAPVAEEAGSVLASTPMIRQSRCWPECRVASSATTKAKAGDGDRQQSERRHLPVLRDVARGRKEAHRQGPGRDDSRFGARKIWKIHFRNVSAPLPHFVETFMDNGYYDMWKIMKALRDERFDGIVILDHSPTMVGGNYTQTAYGFAYMKALLDRANAEAKG